MKQKGVIILFSGLGVLTLIVLVALFFFYPKDTATRNLGNPAQLTSATPDSATGTPVPNTFDPVEWTRSAQGATSATSGTPDTTGTTSGAAATGTTSAGTTSTTGTSTTGGNAPADGFVVTMNPPTSPSSAPTPSVSFPADSGSGVSSGAPAETAKPAAVRHSAPSRTKTEVAKAATVKRPVVRTPQYWIQVGAYKDRYQASQASKSLEAQGLKGSLFTAVSAGQTIVRVRVGPYADKKEAEKFLAWVKPVKGMEGSFITVVRPD